VPLNCGSPSFCARLYAPGRRYEYFDILQLPKKEVQNVRDAE